MARLISTLLASLALATAAHAQFAVGFRDASIANPTTSGSRTQPCRIYYPATSAGMNTPLRKQNGGYPVVVHLHGLGARSTDYRDLGSHLASIGFVIVVSDTATSNAGLQLQDAIAMYPSLVAENRRSGSFLNGALNMKASGIAGHSMGGGNVVRTLANNPGYVAGFCFAPWDGTIFGQGSSWTASAPNVKSPLSIVHGEGDTVVNWQSIGLRFYNRASRYTGLKSFLLLDKGAKHSNIIRLASNPTKADRDAFGAARAAVTGWFDRHLRQSVTGLETVVGRVVRTGPLFKALASEYRTPELWRFGAPKIGTTSRLSIGSEPGQGAIFISPATKTIPLPWGVLKLDPAVILPFASGTVFGDRLLASNVSIPNDRTLIGKRAWFQALTSSSRGLQLTDAVPYLIQ